MTRTVRDRRALFGGDPPPEAERDHHCHVIGCYGQTKRDRQRRFGEPAMRPSDRRRAAASTPE